MDEIHNQHCDTIAALQSSRIVDKDSVVLTIGEAKHCKGVLIDDMHATCCMELGNDCQSGACKDCRNNNIVVKTIDRQLAAIEKEKKNEPIGEQLDKIAKGEK